MFKKSLIFFILLSSIFTNKCYSQEGQIIIKFKKDKIDLNRLKNYHNIFQYIGAKNNQKKLDNFVNKNDLEPQEYLSQENIYLLKLNNPNKTTQDIIDQLQNDPHIEFIQPNFQYQSAAITSNDPYISQMWPLENIGQTINRQSGLVGADLKANEAWKITEGNNNIIVAVIDTGVNYQHPDLKDNMWDGSNCRDDSNNFLGGCLYGYNFEYDNKNPIPTDNDHGTKVSGTIAAIKNNNRGVIGIAPKIKLMALKTNLNTYEIIRAINFAKYNGAKIINASFGSVHTSCQSSTDKLMMDSIRSFPGIFIASAGNSSKEHNGLDYFVKPADYAHDSTCWQAIPNLISVASTDQKDYLATDFSDYGKNFIDIAAPGTNLYTTSTKVGDTSIIYEEKFTSGFPSNWQKTQNSTWSVVTGTDNKKKLVTSIFPNKSLADQSIYSPIYDLSSTSTGAKFSMNIGCDTSDNYQWSDYLSLSYSSDGVNFTEHARFNRNSVQGASSENIIVRAVSKDIPPNFRTQKFRFQLRWINNSSSSNYQACYIYGIKINKYSYQFNNEEYAYAQGTSFSAAYTSGVAALVLSNNPNLSSTQLKDLITQTGDSKTNLSNKVFYSKRINAFNALKNSNPSISGLISNDSPQKSKTFNWTSENSTDLYRYSFDQDPNSTPQGDFSNTRSFSTPTSDGTYYLHVQAKNSFGILGQTKTAKVVLTTQLIIPTPTPKPTIKPLTPTPTIPPQKCAYSCWLPFISGQNQCSYYNNSQAIYTGPGLDGSCGSSNLCCQKTSVTPTPTPKVIVPTPTPKPITPTPTIKPFTPTPTLPPINNTCTRCSSSLCGQCSTTTNNWRCSCSDNLCAGALDYTCTTTNTSIIDYKNIIFNSSSSTFKNYAALRLTTSIISNNTSYNATNLTGSLVSISSISNIPASQKVVEAFKFGITNIGTFYSPAASFHIYVSSLYNNAKLNIYQSNSNSGPWTVNTTINSSTCTVFSGICNFQSDKSNYFIITKLQ